MSYASEVLVDSPVVYYRCNDASGTLVDSSGNGRDLTSVSGITYQQPSLLTDSSNKSVSMAGSGSASGSYNPNFTANDFTVELWINPNAVGASIFCSNGPGGGWRAGIGPGGLYRFTTLSVLDYDFAVGPTIGTKQYVVFVFDTTTKDVTLYIDGLLSQTVLGSSSPNSTAASFTVGGTWNGVVDEVALYATALSPQRIATHYAASQSSATRTSYASEVLSDNPLVYWRLNDSSGDFVDSSGNGHDATTGGSPGYQQAGALYGDSNKAIYFNGGAGGLVASDTWNQITVGTIESFVKTTGSGGSYRTIVQKTNAYGLFLKDDILIAYSWGSPSGDKSTGLNLATDLYYHVAYTFQDGVSNGSQIYVNGHPVLTFTMSIAGNALALQVATGPGQLIIATLDEVALYGTVLSPARIAAHYAASQALVEQQTMLVMGMLGTHRI